MILASARGRSRTNIEPQGTRRSFRVPSVEEWGWGLGLVYLCAVPVRAGHGLSSVSPFDVALPVVVLLEIAARRRARKPLVVGTILTWAVVALVSWAALSGAWSTSLGDWLHRMILLVEGVAAGWAVWSAVERGGPRPFILALGASGAFSATVACLWFYGMHADPAWTTQPPPDAAAAVSQALRLGSPLVGPSNYFATFLLVYVPATAVLVGRSWWWLAGLLLELVALVSTVSRGALVALPLAAVIAVPLSWRLRDISKPKYALGAVSAVSLTFVVPRLLTPLLNHRQLLPAPKPALGGAPDGTSTPLPSGSGAAPGSGPLPLPGSAQPPETTTSETLSAIVNPSGRGTLAREALNLWREHPLQGVGFGNWRSNVPPASASGAHNSLLQLAAELGAVGLGIALWLMGVIFERARRIDDSAIRWAGLTIVVGVVINSFVEASIEGVAFFVFLGCVFGGLVGIEPMSRRVEEMKR